MLETRMRNKGKAAGNEQSLRSIKSTDSKKIITAHKNKMLIFQEKSNGSAEEEEADKVKLEEEIKNNRKITDYFNVKSSAKK